MAIMEISIIPIGTKTTSVSKYVASAVKIIKHHGLKYKLCPMGTIIEGDIEQLFNIAEVMHESVFREGATRVVTNIKIDDRRDKKSSMEQKIKSVIKKI
ncbi:MAG: MTH1187 family thiamine-binding protein [Candidatus Goldbacteria bacterium]|nr:MTH1187 family thiamine-binding protein [Candidatus Goldiibacteriota bacterium]